MVTLRRLRLIARAVARRLGGGSEVEELVESRFAALPFAARRRAVRRYLADIKFLYPKRPLHAFAHGV